VSTDLRPDAPPPVEPSAAPISAPRLVPRDGPSILIHKVPTTRPGTMPAGLVLMVIASALVLAMVLNAPATLRKSNGKADNPEWRTSVASGVATFSGFFGFDAPRNRIDVALGKNQTTDVDVQELVAEQEAQEPAAPADPTPVLRVPTPTEPLLLYVGGDSMSQGLGTSLTRTAGGSELFRVVEDGRVSTGLSRPDFFNWPQHLSRDIDPVNALNPDVVVLLFGANDLQNITTPDAGYEVGSQGWYDEYRRRVGGTMDILRSPNNDRITLWVGMPPMGPRSDIDNVVVDQVNRIFFEESQTRPWVEYVDSWSYFTGADGGYAERVVFADGQDRDVRAGDDIHMESRGYDRMAWAVGRHLRDWVDTSAGDYTPDPSGSAPDDLVERPEPAPA